MYIQRITVRGVHMHYSKSHLCTGGFLSIQLAAGTSDIDGITISTIHPCITPSNDHPSHTHYCVSSFIIQSIHLGNIMQEMFVTRVQGSL